MSKKLFRKVKAKFASKVLFPENKELLAHFGGKEKAYILGTSDTINDLNLKNLDPNALKISLGNFFEHPEIENINPSIHVFAASHKPITEDVLKAWWTRCDEVLPVGVPILIEKRDAKVALDVFKKRPFYKYAYGGDFPIDFTKAIISPMSVSVLAVQLAIYLKAKENYLLGIVHDWRYLKPYRHFYNHETHSLEYLLSKEGVNVHSKEAIKYLPKGTLYNVYHLYKQHENLNKYSKELNLSIFNGDFNSGFDVYEKKLFDY